MSVPMEIEGETMVRRAAGNTAGLTVSAQIRQAARNLGYPVDSWRIREAWYRRCGCWSARAMWDLQQAYKRWLEREEARLAAERTRQATLDHDLLRRQRDNLATELQKLNARLALLDGGGL